MPKLIASKQHAACNMQQQQQQQQQQHSSDNSNININNYANGLLTRLHFD